VSKRPVSIRLSEETVELLRRLYHEMRKSGVKVTEDDIIRMALEYLAYEKIGVLKELRRRTQWTGSSEPSRAGRLGPS